MGAFIVAAIVFALTLVFTALTLFGNMMSDSPVDNQSGAFIWVFAVGTSISIIIASTHWFPSIGW